MNTDNTDDEMRCTCGHPLNHHGPSPRTGKLCCFSCTCDDYQYEGEPEP